MPQEGYLNVFDSVVRLHLEDDVFQMLRGAFPSQWWVESIPRPVANVEVAKGTEGEYLLAVNGGPRRQASKLWETVVLTQRAIYRAATTRTQLRCTFRGACVTWKSARILFFGRTFHDGVSCLPFLVSLGAEVVSDLIVVMDQEGRTLPLPGYLCPKELGDDEDVSLSKVSWDGERKQPTHVVGVTKGNSASVVDLSEAEALTRLLWSSRPEESFLPVFARLMRETRRAQVTFSELGELRAGLEKLL